MAVEGAPDPVDPPGREHRHRRGWDEPRRRGDWGRGPRRGFGCVFALLFLIVAGSLITGTAFVLSQLGPLPGILAIVAVFAILLGMGRSLRSTATTLDALVEATRQVEAGDYSVRVGVPRRGMRAMRQLTRGFDTMTARLEADERQRRTLLADVSHELRTPLTVVQGHVEAIVDGVHPADPAHLATILEETRVLGRLIDDLRTLALSEAGTLALYPEPTDPEVLIGEVSRSFEPAAATAGVTLAVEIDGDLPIVEVDPVRIREVLSNLVANALRHTPSGGRITIAGSLTDEGGGAGARLVFEVRDTGSGIDPALLPHVFDRFVQGDASRGSGLGLAIARGLVEAHRGTIAATSAPGAGTTFRVELPLTAGDAA
jgi:two-component system sensor histidine kinase BaeS